MVRWVSVCTQLVFAVFLIGGFTKIRHMADITQSTPVIMKARL